MVQKGRTPESGTGISFLSGKGDVRELHTELQEHFETVLLKPIWLDSAFSLPAVKVGKGQQPRQSQGKKHTLDGRFSHLHSTEPPRFSMPRVLGHFPEVMNKQVCQ